MAAPTTRLLRLASVLLRTSSSSSLSLPLLRLLSPAVPGGRVVCPPLIRSLAFFSSGTVESVDSEGGALENVAHATKDIIPPSRFANVEMKKGDWICSQCNFMNFARNIRCLRCKSEAPGKDNFDNGGLKSGDWSCPQCNFMNYARNVRCLECKADPPYNLMEKRGDWTCPKCKFLNFARNTFCLRCSAEKSVTYDNLIVRQGDWNCPKCQFMNFARNTDCRACREPRPTKLLRPGDWECPSCKFLNFKRNSNCLKCNCDRPNVGASQTEDHVRNKIELAAGRSLKSISDLSNDITNLLDRNEESESKVITERTLNSNEEDNNDNNYDNLMTLLTEDGRESRSSDSSA